MFKEVFFVEIEPAAWIMFTCDDFSAAGGVKFPGPGSAESSLCLLVDASHDATGVESETEIGECDMAMMLNWGGRSNNQVISIPTVVAIG